MDLEDKVSVPLSDRNKGMLKPHPHSREAETSVALGDKGRDDGDVWEGMVGPIKRPSKGQADGGGWAGEA